ncbi:MAG: asparagine synthase (glutamine-hydrolyzing) [Pseudomonadota bacterium]
MCGIAGLFSPTVQAGQDLAGVARVMAARLEHRGPDDAGVWTDAGIALAHRRLAILDLSAAGHQPMLSSCGRYVLVFNGEIYNHLAIRRTLEQEPGFFQPGGWRGHSDTETLLAAVAAWGVKRTLQATVGMFAIALWDRQSKSLYLARDRMGEKPLYYGLQRGTLWFASELKALRAAPGFDAQVDRLALARYLQHAFVPAPDSIYQGVRKLAPGTFLALSCDAVTHDRLPAPTAYWALEECARKGQAHPYAGTEDEALQKLDSLMGEAVSGQAIADVPLGAFLSGGIDSSTIVALMQAQASQPVQTFTIGFHEPGYNEAEHARAVASHLGTAHTELYVSAAQAMDVIPRLSSLYDEPFADVSQIPTFLVSEMARRQVTVCLSGDGGDELFGGYNRYLRAVAIWRRVGGLPRGVRMALAGLLNAFPPAAWERVFAGLGPVLPRRWRYGAMGDKVYKLADMLAVQSVEAVYSSLVTHWKTPQAIVLDLDAFPGEYVSGDWGALDLEHRMMYQDSICYLPDDILVKVDRAAMGVSLETRVPFLDHRVVEFAWSLPLSMKIRDGQGKWLLRRLLDRYVPSTLIDRPKSGFSVPLDAWLRGPLRPWAESLLDANVLRQQGFFAQEPIRTLWNDHLSGKRNGAHQLWTVLMFQSWYEAQRSG